MPAIQTIMASAPKGAIPERLRQTKAAIAAALFVLLPLFATADYRARILRFSSLGDTSTVFSQVVNLPDEQALYFAYYNTPFGIGVRSGSSSVETPSLSSTTYGSLLNNQISFGDNYYTNSPAKFPRVYDLYVVAASLIGGGYSGPGVQHVANNGSHGYYNVYFHDLVSDVLSSTNTVWRQLLLSHLSAISSSVQNIELNVSGLQSSVDRGNDILSSVSNSSLLALAPLSSIASNSSFSASLEGFVHAAVVDFHSFIGDLLDNGEITQANADSWLRTYDEYSNPTSRAVFATLVSRNINDRAMADSFLSVLNSSPHLLRDPGSYFNEGVVDALIGDYPSEESKRGLKAVNSRTSIKSQMNNWRDDLKRQLEDWKSDLKQDLQDWKTSDARGILNIRQIIEDNLSSKDPRNPDPSNSVPFTAFTTNNITAPVTNAVRQSSQSIQSNATENASRQIEDNQERWDEFKRMTTGEGQGLNVRIVNPLWEEGGYHVNVRDDGVIQAIQDNMNFSPPELTAIADYVDWLKSGGDLNVDFAWQPWFDRFGPYSDIVTNYYAQFNATVPSANVASDFLESGFDFARYDALPWFQRVEVLLAMIADVRSNSVEVADIRDEMEEQAANFHNLSTNVVSASSDVVGLFDYVRRFSAIFETMFSDKAAPLTGDYVLLPAGSWIGDSPLVLRVNPTIQNLCRLIMQCIWYLGFLVLLWVVVQWCWSKVVAVLRWLWSMFDV